MGTLHDVERLLGNLTRAEKATLLQWVVRDLGGRHPSVEMDPDVRGGEARITRTRILVWVLERARREEMDRDITENEAA